MPFRTNPVNVGVERDFYRIQPLEPGDLEFIKRLAIEPTETSSLRKLNEGWLDQFHTIFSLISLVEHSGKVDDEIQSQIDQLLNDIEEDRLAKIEYAAINYLDHLVEGDGAFLQDGNSVMDFSVFLVYQYFRTKKIQENILNKFRSSQRTQFERCWPILRLIFVTNVAFSVFTRRDIERPVLLRNDTSCQFITSDQPVINTYGVHNEDTEHVDRVELYYPVSPRYAVIFSDHPVHSDTPEEGISEFRAEYFNQLVEASSYQQLFANECEALSTRQCGKWKVETH